MRKPKVSEGGFSPRNAAVRQHGWHSDLDVSYPKVFMFSVISGFSLWGLLWETPPVVLSSSCGDRNDMRVHTHTDTQTLSVEMSTHWVWGRATAPGWDWDYSMEGWEFYFHSPVCMSTLKHTSGHTEGEIRRMKEIPTSNWALPHCHGQPMFSHAAGLRRVDWGWGNN